MKPLNKHALLMDKTYYKFWKNDMKCGLRLTLQAAAFPWGNSEVRRKDTADYESILSKAKEALFAYMNDVKGSPWGQLAPKIQQTFQQQPKIHPISCPIRGLLGMFGYYVLVSSATRLFKPGLMGLPR